MRKEIKSYGHSAVIVLTKSDLKLYKLKIGDIKEVELIDIAYNKKRKIKNESKS